MSKETLSKSERICGYHLIEQIFSKKEGGSFSDFPIRLVYYPSVDGNKILVSVPKRHFKHAVDRNRIKRQVREAYRKNKSLIANCSFAMAFIWIAGKMLDTTEVEEKIVHLLKSLNNNAIANDES